MTGAALVAAALAVLATLRWGPRVDRRWATN